MLYEQAADLPADLLGLVFKRPLEEQMAMSPSDIQAWFSNWLPVVDKKLREQQALGAAFKDANGDGADL